MKCEDVRWHEDEHPLKGYKWSIRAEYGTVEVEENDLFSRPEFKPLPTHEHKVAYAMDLGWRYNVDNGLWYRILGY